MPIGLSPKSLFTAWLRGVMALAVIFGVIGASVFSNPVEGRGSEPDAHTKAVISIVVIGVAVAIFVATYHRRFRLASHRRAARLAAQAGLSDADLIAVERVYTS